MLLCHAHFQSTLIQFLPTHSEKRRQQKEKKEEKTFGIRDVVAGERERMKKKRESKQKYTRCQFSNVKRNDTHNLLGKA